MVILNLSVAVEEEGGRWRKERRRRKRIGCCFLEILTFSFICVLETFSYICFLEMLTFSFICFTEILK